jgi:hypothetical protein
MCGLVIAGPAAALAGPGRVLGAGAGWAVLSSLVVLSLSSIRARSPGPAMPAARRGAIDVRKGWF